MKVKMLFCPNSEHAYKRERKKRASWAKLQFGYQTTPAAIILKKRCVLELPRLSRPPFKSDSSSNLEAVNVHHENLLSFQILRNYNHGSNDDAS